MAKAMMSVEVIADLVCNELGDNTGAKKFRILQYIALGWQQMELYLNNNISVKSMVLKDSNELPNDCVFVTKVGIRKNGRIFTLRQATKLVRHNWDANDTQLLKDIHYVFEETDAEPDGCFFYNLFDAEKIIGSIQAYGLGYSNHQYYDVQNGRLEVSSCIPADAELIVEYQSDGLSYGLKLVPAETFLALRSFAYSLYFNEGPNGPNQLNYESYWKTLSRTYNFKPVNTFVYLFT